ncbi:hypothetical protein [uncultured Dokdonia sp.]|uniref:hypothetical protein n=1 Tax=uncultured Dokdonia sp. TaxID=575653 RepID=UPI0026185CC3|nr:hypothetical protein [uncultured Dokdonia sp.]
MLKKILNVKGVERLSTKEQQLISGGGFLTFCSSDDDCRVPGFPNCRSACLTNINGQNLCVFEVSTCSDNGGGVGIG